MRSVTYRPKRCGNNNKVEDNSPKTLNDKNHQASSQKFRQRIHNHIYICRHLFISIYIVSYNKGILIE